MNDWPNTSNDFEWKPIPISWDNDKTHTWIATGARIVPGKDTRYNVNNYIFSTTADNHMGNYRCTKCGLIKDTNNCAIWNVSCDFKQNYKYSVYTWDISRHNIQTHNLEMIRLRYNDDIVYLCKVCNLKIYHTTIGIGKVIQRENNLSCDEMIIRNIIE
jgi:hypothetical protein